MTLQEIIKSLDELSVQDQTALLQVLEQRLTPRVENEPEESMTQDGEAFWQGVLRFREQIEQEGIVFTDEDFADLRNRNPGREIEL